MSPAHPDPLRPPLRRAGGGPVEPPAASRIDAAADERRRRILRLLRWLLPTAAVLAVTVALIWPQIQPRDDRVRIGMEVAEKPAEAPAANTNALTQGEFTGIDEHGRPFTVKADKVRSLAAGDDVLELTDADASIVLKDGTPLKLKANTGVYDRTKSAVELTGAVTLKRGDDLAVHTDRATIGLDNGTASGPDPVHAEGAFGTLEGQSFRVTNDGKTLVVDGPAKMLINPQAKFPLK